MGILKPLMIALAALIIFDAAALHGNLRRQAVHQFAVAGDSIAELDWTWE